MIRYTFIQYIKILNTCTGWLRNYALCQQIYIWLMLQSPKHVHAGPDDQKPPRLDGPCS